jgi:hypothetical protein
MGYNTVAFLLNDMMGDIAAAPKTLAYALSHPHLFSDQPDYASRALQRVAEGAGERWNPQALTVMPTWHADAFKFFVAGRNTIAELKWLRGGRSEFSRQVTLELPEWWLR